MFQYKPGSHLLSIIMAFLLIGAFSLSSLNATPAHAAGILYVVPDAYAMNGDCSSWANACMLQSALAAANSGDEIWAVSGTYMPGIDQNATFTLVDGVALYGGFLGAETERMQRNPMHNITVLSGGSYIYHVVQGANGATLDGFVITNGNANSGGSGNHGGGILNPVGSSLILTGVTFYSNFASSGGGIYNQGTLLITNNTFYDNNAFSGGGIYNDHGILFINNSTFYNNNAIEGNSGGGILNWYGTLNYNNTIIAASPNGGDCANLYGSIGTNINNLVQDGSCAAIFTGNPQLNVIYEDENVIQMELSSSSPAIGAGDNATCSSIDQRGTMRPQGLSCDIGAYEYLTDDVTPPNITTFTVNSPSTSLLLPIISFGASDNGSVTGYMITESAIPPSSGSVLWSSNPPSTYRVAVSGIHALYPWAKDSAGNVSTTFDAPAIVDIYCQMDIIVTNANNSGPGSLRQAIADVCADGFIRFDGNLKGATISLTSSLILPQNITIDGSMLAPQIIINGGGNVTVFQVNTGVTASLNSLTITNGRSTYGGGIYNSGTLTLENSNITNNQSRNDGAGIYNAGTLMVGNSTLSGNVAIQDGGGINSVGTLTVINSRFSGNSAWEDGGGIRDSGTVTISYSTFSGNSASSGAGVENLGTLNISNSIFSTNAASFLGGGINTIGTANITNSTFLNNSANSGGGGIENSRTATISNSTFVGNTSNYSGGGIHNYSYFPVNIFNSTFSGNAARVSGGGIYINNFGGKLNFANTIIANSVTGGDCVNMGPIGTNINNMVEDGSCSASLSGDPNLDVLADNGGSTLTMALNAGSPAIDAGNDAICAADPVNSKDQRGAVRPTGSQCDIGAYEVGLAPTATPTNTSTITRTPTSTFTPSSTATPSATPTSTLTATETITVTRTNTPTLAASSTETLTRTPTTSTITLTATAVDTMTTTPTATDMPNITNTPAPTLTNTATITKTPTKTRTPTPITISLQSIRAHDGWILESSETSNVGGKLNSAATTFRLGDNAAKKQYRGILSFNTGAALPDTAVITKITLKLKKYGFIGGTNLMTAYQGLMVDIKKGYFGSSTALETGDFQALTNFTYGPFLPSLSSNYYSLDLTNGKNYFNKLAGNGGTTQLRLRFKLDDNNNAIANYLSLYSGNATLAADRPQLVITYSMP